MMCAAFIEFFIGRVTFTARFKISVLFERQQCVLLLVAGVLTIM